MGRDRRGLALGEGLAERPIRSGAESFIAGTASCRIEVADVDGNLLTFFCWEL